MRQLGPITLAAVIALGAATSLASLAWAAPPATHRPTPGPPASTCVSDGTAVASPRQVLLGETTAITLHFRAICPSEDIRLHVVFVVDPSARMDRSVVRELRDVLKWYVLQFDLKNNPATKVGVVLVDDEARAIAPLTHDVDRVNRALGRIQPEGDTRIDLGIEEGLRILMNARGPGTPINEVLMVFADGYNTTGCRDAVAAMKKARSQGVITITVCVGRDCDRQCMLDAASSNRYFFDWEQAKFAIQLGYHVRKDFWRVTLRRLTVIETLPANMDYVEGSAIPEPSEITTDTRRLTWTQNFVPADGLTVTYRVRPRAPGHHPISLGARAEFRDNMDRVGAVNFRTPYVDVLEPFPAPTPTPTAP